MNRFTFFRQVVTGLLLSIIGSVLMMVLTPVLGSQDASRVVLLILSFGYVLMLLQHLAPRVGITMVVSGWLLTAALLLLFNPPLLVWVVVCSALLWLVRSGLRYQRLYPFTLDALLTLFALCCGIAALLYSQRVGLALWSYFLVLAFSAAIPARPSSPRPSGSTTDVFTQAETNAQRALRQLQKLPR